MNLHKIIFIVIFTIFIPVNASAVFIGPYSGKIIDSSSDKPIQGASVLFFWEKSVFQVIESRSEIIGTKLVHTDKNGFYRIPMSFSPTGFLSRFESTNIVVYQPGYQAFILTIWNDHASEAESNFKKRNNIIKLDRIPPVFNYEDHYKKIESALYRLWEYPYSDPNENNPCMTVSRILKKTSSHIPDREYVLRRAEWEKNRVSSVRYRESCKNINDTNDIIRALDNENPFIRAEAAKTLGYYKDKQVIEPLIKTIKKDKDPWVRLNAVVSIGELRSQIANVGVGGVPASNVKHNNMVTGGRITFSNRWGNLTSNTSIDYLLDLINDDSNWQNKFAQQECIITLLRIRANSENVISELLDKFKDDYLKLYIIRFLRIFRTMQAKELLMEASKDSNDSIRKEAHWAIFWLPIEWDRQRKEDHIFWVNFFMNSLKDSNPDVRKASLAALGKIREINTFKYILNALDEKDEDIKIYALKALRGFDNEKLYGVFLDYFGDKNEALRKEAIYAFLSLCMRTSREMIYLLYVQDNIEYYKRIPTPLVDDPYISRTINYVIHPVAVENILKKLKEGDTETKINILEILFRFEDKRIEHALNDLLDDPSPQVREKAALIKRNFTNKEKIVR